MPNVEEIRAICPDVSFKEKEGGGWTCRFFREHKCIAAGHNGADCVVFPSQTSLPAPEPSEPSEDVLGVGGSEGSREGENGDESPGSEAVVEPDAPAESPIWDMTWSASRINTFMRCPYKFYLHYIEGLEADPRPDWAVYGGAMHEALEHFFRGEDMIFDSTERPEVDAKVAGKLDGLRELGVLDEIRDQTEWEVEGKRDFTFGFNEFGPMKWTTRLDLLSKDGNIIADHKSTGADPSSIRIIDILYQMSAYCMAVRSADEVKINTIYKPRLRKKKTEEWGDFQERVKQDVIAHRAKYFLQHTYSRAEIQPEKHFNVLCGQVLVAIEAMKNNHFMRNPSDCNFGAKCEFEAECIRRL